MTSLAQNPKIFSRNNARGHTMTVYYDILPVVSTSLHYRTYFNKDGTSFISDFSVPHSTMFAQFDPLASLLRQVKTHLGFEDVVLLKSEFLEKLEAHQADPKNWPTQTDDDYGHPWGMDDDD